MYTLLVPDLCGADLSSYAWVGNVKIGSGGHRFLYVAPLVDLSIGFKGANVHELVGRGMDDLNSAKGAVLFFDAPGDDLEIDEILQEGFFEPRQVYTKDDEDYVLVSHSTELGVFEMEVFFLIRVSQCAFGLVGHQCVDRVEFSSDFLE